MLAKKRKMGLREVLLNMGFVRLRKGIYGWQMSSTKGMHFIKVSTKRRIMNHSSLKNESEMSCHNKPVNLGKIQELQEIMLREIQ